MKNTHVTRIRSRWKSSICLFVRYFRQWLFASESLFTHSNPIFSVNHLALWNSVCKYLCSFVCWTFLTIFVDREDVPSLYFRQSMNCHFSRRQTHNITIWNFGIGRQKHASFSFWLYVWVIMFDTNLDLSIKWLGCHHNFQENTSSLFTFKNFSKVLLLNMPILQNIVKSTR